MVNLLPQFSLSKVAETARKLGIIVIADEVYNHLCFGSKPFVPIGAFGSIAPVLTIGTISKRWIVPGWRLGWIALTDCTGILHKSGVSLSLSFSPHFLAYSPLYTLLFVPSCWKELSSQDQSRGCAGWTIAQDPCYK